MPRDEMAYENGVTRREFEEVKRELHDTREVLFAVRDQVRDMQALIRFFSRGPGAIALFVTTAASVVGMLAALGVIPH